MKRIGFPLLALSSVLWAGIAGAATRAHYGGTLHVAMRTAPASLDPCESGQLGFLSNLMFDTLVLLDDQGRPVSALASSWQAEPGNQRWQFVLRRGVTFQDGTPVTPDTAAASLRKSNPTWKVFSEGDAIIIERDSPVSNLPAELALPRNSIVKRDGGKVAGSGPFTIAELEPGKNMVLSAREDYWGGRPFVDAIEIELGKSFRDQMISFDLGRTQVIEVAPEQIRRAAAEGRQVESSAPVELMALVFPRDPQSPDDARQRRAFALSLDRGLLKSVVLQDGAQPAGGLLPNWMTGYSFVFPAMDLALARQVRSEIPHTTSWTLSYDALDPTARVVAERIALNARDAGLGLQITGGSNADLRLIRISLGSLDAPTALGELAARLGFSQPSFISESIDDLYVAENKLLQSQRVIPLLHLRTAWAVSGSVKNWKTTRDGQLNIADAWLAAGKP